MDIVIKAHRAMTVPRNALPLQQAIVKIARMLDDEAPLYLGAAYGLTVKEATALHTIFTLGAKEPTQVLARKSGLKSGWSQTSGSLREKLRSSNVIIEAPRGGYTKMTPQGQFLAESTLTLFKKTKDEVCGLLGTRTLKVLPHDLPRDPERMHTILIDLLDRYRADPADIVLEGKTPPEFKLILGPYAAAIRDGQDHVSLHRLEASLFPPFAPDPRDNARTSTLSILNHVRDHFGCPHERVFGGSAQNIYAFPIEEPIRQVLTGGAKVPAQRYG